MTTQFAYSPDLFPPVPTLEIILTSSEIQLSTVPRAGLVDTGADATFASISLLEQIKSLVGKSRYARSIWGERHLVQTFVVDVRIGDWTLPGVYVVAYDGDEVILGRDVLNKLRLLLDGPAQTTEMLEVGQKRK